MAKIIPNVGQFGQGRFGHGQFGLGCFGHFFEVGHFGQDVFLVLVKVKS